MADASKKNVLWIMCDQLRYDYLGCTGHPFIDTPNIDRLAKEGVLFDRAYAQAPICGASRMSAYTGRYVKSHGASSNEVPLKAGEMTLGDHLTAIDARAALVGKTHMRADNAGMVMRGLDPESDLGRMVGECGFELVERFDGLHPDGDYDPGLNYKDYLRQHGMDGDNLWEEWANGTDGPNGEILSGWMMENADKPARVPEEHSETAWTTNRAMDFMRAAEQNDQNWCLHLSYIKPHWPYIAPAPYHDIYDASHVVPPVRNDAELDNPHPFYDAFTKERYSTVFSRDGVRERVIPAYMGLIKQVDDHLGRLFAFMEEQGLMDNTLIIFTADHGDYLGDHWLGEKYLFHDPSIRLPMLVHDPRKDADATRGKKSDALVEMIDLVPTIVDYMGGNATALGHVLEGESLLPLTTGKADDTVRKAVFSEYDYAYDTARLVLKTGIDDSTATMVFDGRWKYVHVPDHDPILFDLENDPDELNDLGRDPACENTVLRMKGLMFDWLRRPAQRTTISQDDIAGGSDLRMVYDAVIDHGIYIGYWNDADVREELNKRDSAGLGPQH